MLSKQEKEEMIRDAGDKDRKEQFIGRKKYRAFSLDDYLKFLRSIQNIFPVLPVSHKKTITSKNLL